MSEKSSNPLLASADVLLRELKNASGEIINWLIKITGNNGVSEKNYNDTQVIIDSLKNQYPYVYLRLELFMPLFLWGNFVLPECFDKKLGKKDIINSISGYFDNDTGILRYSLLPILGNIQEWVKTDKKFRMLYQKAKNDALQQSSLKERILTYMSFNDFDSKLVKEMEGITIGKDDKYILPALVWGKNVYKALYSLYHETKYEGIYADIPEFNKNKNAAKVFLHIALTAGNTEIIKAVFRDNSSCQILERLIEIFYDRPQMDNLIYSGFYGEYSDPDRADVHWLHEYEKCNIDKKTKFRSLYKLLVDLLKEKTLTNELRKKLIPMLDKPEIVNFLEEVYSVLTQKQKERLLSLVCKKISLPDFIDLISENNFEEFNSGILEGYSFTLLLKLLKNYETCEIDESLRKYLNKFYENIGNSIDYEEATEYFQQFHCIDWIIEQEQKDAEQKQKEQQQPSTLYLALNLQKASSYDEILEVEQKFGLRNGGDDNPENEQLNQIVFDSINKATNENDESFIELIRLSCFHDQLKDIFNNILAKHEDVKQKLLEKCRKVMALLRRVMASQGQEDTKRLATEASKYAFWFIQNNSGYGKAIKPYILALRAASDPLVSTDLKCAYNTVSYEIFRRLELKDDNETSKKLRQDLANDFTEFLKPIPEKDSGDPRDRLQNYSEKEKGMSFFDITRREPNEHWRYAYVRALVDLGIDNDGKGHFFHNVLDKVAESDKSPMVRDAAKEASKELKSLRGGYTSGSPKRHLLQAYWWLRRAHLQTLGIEINNEEALKVRVTEYR